MASWHDTTGASCGMDKRLLPLAVIYGLLLLSIVAAQDAFDSPMDEFGNTASDSSSDVANIEDTLKTNPAAATAEDLNSLAQAKGWKARFAEGAKVTSYDGKTIKTQSATFNPGELAAAGSRVTVLDTGELVIGSGKVSGSEIKDCPGGVCITAGKLSKQSTPGPGEKGASFVLEPGEPGSTFDYGGPKIQPLSGEIGEQISVTFTDDGETKVAGVGKIVDDKGQEIATFTGIKDDSEATLKLGPKGTLIDGIYTLKGCQGGDCLTVTSKPDHPVLLTQSSSTCTDACVSLRFDNSGTLRTLLVKDADFTSHLGLSIVRLISTTSPSPAGGFQLPTIDLPVISPTLGKAPDTVPANTPRAVTLQLPNSPWPDTKMSMTTFTYASLSTLDTSLSKLPLFWQQTVAAYYRDGTFTLQQPGYYPYSISTDSMLLHSDGEIVDLSKSPPPLSVGTLRVVPANVPFWPEVPYDLSLAVPAPTVFPPTPTKQPAPEAPTPADTPPPPPKAAPEPTVIAHKVLAGDNPTQLARIYGVTEADIVKANLDMGNRRIVAGSPVIITEETLRVPISDKSLIPVDVLNGKAVVYSTATGSQFKTVVTKDANGEPIMAWAKVDADYNKEENAVVTEPKILVKPEDLATGNLKYLTNPRYYASGRFDVDPIDIPQAAAAPQATPDAKAVPAPTAAQPQPLVIPGAKENAILVNGEAYRPTTQPYEGTIYWEKRTYGAFGDEIWTPSDSPYASVKPAAAGTLPNPISPDQYKTPSAAFANKQYVQFNDGAQITQIVPNKDSSGDIFGVTINPGTDKEAFVPFESGNPNRPSKEWTIKQLVDYANAPLQGTTVAETPITGQSKGSQLPIYIFDPNTDELFSINEKGEHVSVPDAQSILPQGTTRSPTSPQSTPSSQTSPPDQLTYVVYETKGTDGKTYQLVQGYDFTKEAQWRVLSGYDDVSGEPLWEASKGPLSATSASSSVQPPKTETSDMPSVEFPSNIVDNTDPSKVITTVGSIRLVTGEDGNNYWQKLETVDESGTQVWVTDPLTNKVEGKVVHSALTNRDFVRISGNTGTFWMVVDKSGRFVGLASDADASILDDIDQYTKAGRFTTADIPPQAQPTASAQTISGKLSNPLNPNEVISRDAITRGYGVERHPILGYDKMHTGIDLRGSVYGTDIRASGEGKVMSYDWEGGYGKVLTVRQKAPDGQTIDIRYAHTANAKVNVGQTVTLGQSIATAGSTGLSTGVHTHLEVVRNGQKIDPCNYFCTSSRVAGR